MYGYSLVSKCSRKLGEAVGFPGLGATGSCDLFDVNAETRTQESLEEQPVLLTGELALAEPGACCFGLAGQQGLRTLLSATQPQRWFSRYM